MKIYVVKEPSGEYEDYKENIIGVYSNYQLVERLINNQDENIRKQQIALKKCADCKFNEVPRKFIDDIDKPKCFNSINTNNYICGEKYVFCNRNGLRYTDAIQPLIVEEYELNKGIENG